MHELPSAGMRGVNGTVLDNVRALLQGLNIAPALISIAPTKTVVNPVGPLAISDTLIAATVPALPGP
jgi:hypothetical protein